MDCQKNEHNMEIQRAILNIPIFLADWTEKLLK